MKKSLPHKFHIRFNLSIDVSSVQKKFVNRVKNIIWDNYIETLGTEIARQRVCWQIANKLGHQYAIYYEAESYTKKEFYTTLQAIEIAYDALETSDQKDKLHGFVLYTLGLSEIDLGISFKDGRFIRKGAKLLDEKLVNDALDWLSDKKYKSVLSPFEKGLGHMLEADKKPSLRNDVITDMYEAVEALAKIITKRPSKDLSANAELFIKSLRVSEYYKKFLKEYISYANIFRHGQSEESPRPTPTFEEVESFVYMTGLFIRLTIASAA